MTTEDDAEVAIRIAESHLAAGKDRRAEEVARASLAGNPNHPRLLTAYARAKLGQSEYDAAARSVHAALAVAPEDEYAMRVYSHALEMLGRVPEALRMAERTVTVHPHSSLAHQNHARMLEVSGRPVEAMAAVEEALRLAPLDADLLNLRGDIHLALAQLDPAEADFLAALRLNPADAEAVHNLAKTNFVRGRRWGAIAGFLGVGRLDPSYGDVARHNIGVVLTDVLRRSAWVVLIVAFAVIYTSTTYKDGHSTVMPRIVAGTGAILLFVTYTRVMHQLPRRTLKSVLRQRKILAVRVLQLFAGVVLGAQAAVFGAMTLPAILASILVLSLPVVVVVGRLTDERLW